MLLWSSIILATLCVILLLLRPWSRGGAGTGADEDRLRVSIYRQNLQELDREFERGQLTREQLDNVRRELELSLLAEMERDRSLKKDAAPAPVSAGSRSVMVPVALFVLISLPLYFWIGNPQLGRLQQFSEAARLSDGSQPLPVEDYLPQMREHLERNPGDANGWVLMADMYSAKQDYASAADALASLYALTGDDADVMMRYANALVMANDGKFGGKPAELARRVIAMDPQNHTALLFAGMAADEAGDYAASLQYYRKLLPALQGNAAIAQTVEALIARNEQLLREAGVDPGSTAAETDTVPAASLQISVTVSAELAGRYGPDDTLFVYAQAIDGPPMPLAVARHQASELPLTVTLDDSMAMMPTMKLSAFAKVKLQARISKTGNAQPEPGDLSGVLEPVEVPAAGALDITIDTVLP